MDQNDVVGNTHLEIKVISGEALRAFNFFQKLSIYAVASLSAADSHHHHLPKHQIQEQRTPTDHAGDGHPEWNHPISFHLIGLPSPSDLFLRFDLHHHAGPLFPDRTIGEVRVPLSDLLDSPSSGTFRFVDYQVRSPDGKPNGVLRFAYNMIGNGHPNALAPEYSDHLPVRISGYPHISDEQDKPPHLYPAAADLVDEARPTVYHTHALPPPIWRGPPPYWPPPGYTPRPPPPGYYHQGWSYPTE